MEHLAFCLNATMPVFLLMLLGMLLHKLGPLDDIFASKLNKFVFQISLPALVFENMLETDFATFWDGPFVLFCFCATLASILLAAVCSMLMKDQDSRGEFVQASYRSSAALLGVAIMQNLYGTAGAAPLMIIGAVPLYNAAAVVVLNAMSPGKTDHQNTWKHILKGIVTNPILLGIAAGCLWSVLSLPQPTIFTKTVSSIANTATPLGLLAMGAAFNFKKATGALRPALVCTLMKLVVFVAIFLPIAIALGFRNDQLVAILIMLGAATTVSCYVMAKNLGYQGILTTNTVMLTTLLSSFTLTFWLWLIRSMGLI